MTDPLILIRSVHIAATVLAAGTVGFRALAMPPGAEAAALRRPLDWTVWSALAVAVLSGAVWLVLLASDILGGSILDVCLHGGVWQVATDTRFGWIWGARLGLALMIGVLLWWPEAHVPPLIAAAAFIGLLAPVGHAGAASGLAGRLHLISDTAHLLAAGAWLGGLPALALLLARARRFATPPWHAVAAVTTRRFSVIGIAAVGTLLASGVFNSWNLLSGPGDLLATDYGRLIMLKIGLFAAMVGLAGVNRYRLTPLIPAPGAMRSLQRNTIGEIGLGLGVLLFVGALGTMPPPVHIHAPSSGIPADAAFVHIHTAEIMADVTIKPGRVGLTKVRIRVLREESSEFAVKELRFRLDPRDGGAGPVEQAAARRPDGSWEVERLEIGQPGIWTVRVLITTGAGTAVILDAPVVIDR
ncbi:MAG: copper homeostasis membrane protein CopD [Pseudolabrys sp.]